MRLMLLAAASVAALTFAAQAAAAADVAPAPAAATAGPTHYGSWGVDLTSENHAVSPGDDFFMYGDGAWYDRTEIPADQASTGVGYSIYNRTQDQLRAMIEEAAAHPDTPTAQKVGGLYHAFMDEARIEALDDKPLRPDLARIAAIKDKAQFAVLMGQTNGGFGKSIVGAGPSPDPVQPQMNVLWMAQDGLGLPDRDYYLTDNFKPQREAYRAYVERTLTMIGYPDPAANADAILAFETRVAQASWAAADMRDIDKLNNPMTVAQLQAYAPGLDWQAYLAAAGTPHPSKIIVTSNTSIQKIAAIYAETPLPVLKAWETFHVASDASPYLSKRFVDSKFALAQALSGVKTLRPRWKRGVVLTEGTLGEAVGQAYVAKYFPPDAKAKMQDLVANLKTAMAGRIENASWMARSTKDEALKKLSKMDVQVGYPDKWRDYSALKIDPDDLYGDVQRGGRFELAYQLSDLDKPVDHHKWGMTPQTVNAYNGGLENRIVFPAGILQAPLFDPSADPAVNYGAIGAIIGHEITHGFDDQGRKIDDTGKVRDWWTADDAKKFEVEAAKYGGQYDGYEAVPGMHINGKLTMGENIADLGGLLAALDAYHASLRGQPAPVIDGLTGDQRFFLAFAQAWEDKTRDDATKQQMASDPHSPSKFRAIGPTRNIDAWYAAFGVKDGKYYLKPEDRARIW
jgi:putative endopeptidase